VVSSVLSGDSDSYELLVNKYSGLVYSLANKSFSSKDEVEDFAQDVFLSAYESLSGFRGEAQFSTWLYQIAKNRLAKHWNKKVRIKEDPWKESILEHADQEKASIGEFLEKEEIQDTLRRLIQRLPKMYQLPIILHYFENRPLQEISQNLNIKINTIKSHISRGKDLIRKWWPQDFQIRRGLDI